MELTREGKMKITKVMVLIAVFAAACFAQEAATPVEPKVLRDGAGAKMMRFENLHQTRYVEIFLIFRDAKTGTMEAACYNPMFTSKGVAASHDAAPQEQIEGLDFAKMSTDFNVLSATLNGPKLWQPDWAEVDAGVVRDFNGIKAAWTGQLNMSKGGVGEGTPYQPMTVARKRGLGWNTGTTVLLLDDAEGNTWIMKGFELGVAPKYTFEQFVTAGQSIFRELPAGWKFRVKKLTQDLTATPESGIAAVMSDEFFNVYEKTGTGLSNYKP